MAYLKNRSPFTRPLGSPSWETSLDSRGQGKVEKRNIMIKILRIGSMKEVSRMNSLIRLIPRQEGLLSLIPEFEILGRFFDDLEVPAVFGREGELVPAFDIAETDNKYTITGEIPGMEAKDLNVTYTNGVLNITGEKRKEQEEKDRYFHRIEREYGSFHRGFCLPENVRGEEAKADYKDGVLKITLPKTEIETKRIEVKEERASKKRETQVEVK
jgi:HSP20 family protein